MVLLWMIPLSLVPLTILYLSARSDVSDKLRREERLRLAAHRKTQQGRTL